jgi:hypothetical protein
LPSSVGVERRLQSRGDPWRKPDGVVFGASAFELGVELTGVGDLLQVRPFALDVAGQGLDPGLVLRLTG